MSKDNQAAEQATAEQAAAEQAAAEQAAAEQAAAEQAAAKPKRNTGRRGKKAVAAVEESALYQATSAAVRVNGKLTVESDPTEVTAAMLNDATFKRHLDYAVECGLIEEV